MSSRNNSFRKSSEFSLNSTTSNDKNNNTSDEMVNNSLSLNDFLDFLNVSCHVNDMIASKNDEDHQKPNKGYTEGNKSSDTVTLSGGTAHGPINFKQLSQNRLISELYGFNRNEDSVAMTKSTNDDGGLHQKLSEKLDYVLNEGILDAVLPFVCPVPIPPNYTGRLKPKQSAMKDEKVITATGLTSSAHEGLNETQASAINKDCAGKVKDKTGTIHVKTTASGNAAVKDPEVVIHVCDEVKNTSKDFICPQSLLVSKMGYFADVTVGQKLEDMDISVHCDIQIFEWLMKWVKSENGNRSSSGLNPYSDSAPNLNMSNVVPILVSASFLQMEPLLLDCLSFCHSHLGDVVRASNNLSSLNDTIITRMAAMFTNVELEMVCDKKNRLLPRLWTKLICSLFEPETEALRGHYFSLAELFKCSKCQTCLTNTMKSYIQCIPGNVRLNRWGQVVSHHVRDLSWDLNYYISQVFKEVKSWRLVYWRLWGHVHYLYCCLCELFFPVYQMSWCRYHPESPTFMGPVAEGRTTGPAGRYACCGQQAFRYETLPGPNGCQFREHSVLVETDRERSILSIVQLATERNALDERPPQRLQEMFANGDIEARWMGISLIPQRCRQGLLPVLNQDEPNSRLGRRVRSASSKFFADSSTETESTDTMDNVRISKFEMTSNNDSFTTSDSDGCESSDSRGYVSAKGYRKKQNRKKKPSQNPGRYWSGELSARSNQDHQREFEEKVMKQVISMVHKKTGLDVCVSQQNRPLGGTYVKLEQEWKEQMKQRTNTLANSSSSINTQLGPVTNSNATLVVKGSRKKVDSNSQQEIKLCAKM